MRANYKVELTSGVFLFLGIAALLWLATEATDFGMQLGDETYLVTANFSNVADLKTRAPVKIGGVTVGLVESITLDPVMFDAVVETELGLFVFGGRTSTPDCFTNSLSCWLILLLVSIFF